MAAALTPNVGRSTFDAEGQEGGRHHSRIPAVPSDHSGLTIGRGYDMKTKSAGTIVNDLVAAGVSKDVAATLSRAAGLKGDAAKKFIRDHKLEKTEISQAAQKKLFEISYAFETGEARRLCQKADVVEKYGACDWNKLHPAIREVVVDLKYTGEYSGPQREFLQKYIVANDLEGFTKTVSDPHRWKNYNKERFARRTAVLKAALTEKKRVEALAQRPLVGPQRPLVGPQR